MLASVGSSKPNANSGSSADCSKLPPSVIVQIKNGPMDFQVREPVSPLLAGGLKRTVSPDTFSSHFGLVLQWDPTGDANKIFARRIS